MSTMHNMQQRLCPPGFKNEKGHIILSSLAINFLSLALPVMTLQIYDRILPNPESGTLPMLITGVCVAIILEACLRLSRSYMTGWSGAKYEFGLSSAAMRHVLATDAAHFSSAGAGEHLHRMSAIAKLKDFYNGYILTACVDIAFVPVYLGFIIYVAGPLTLVPAVILMLYTLVSLADGQRLRKNLKARDAADDKRYNFIIETLDAIHSVKSFSLEKILSRKYEELEETSARENFNSAQAMAGAFNTGTVASHVMIAAIIAIGAVFVLNGQVTAGGLVATLLLSGRMMQMVQRGLLLWVKYQDYLLARDKVAAIFESPAYNRHKRKVTAQDIPTHGTLSIKNLSYGYVSHSAALLRDIDLDLHAGQSISISGDTASGKSTLLKLIAGIYTPQNGEITVDGEKIQNLGGKELSRHVGYITTTPVIFRGTIRDNITRFGEIDELSARKAAALMGIDRDVAKLPLGFDTFLQGNGSDAIPPGFKQRISMARVLAARPRIILFDEADAALDRSGLELTISALQRLRESIALVIISEDQRILGLADTHFILHNGQLSKAGLPQSRHSAFVMPTEKE